MGQTIYYSNAVPGTGKTRYATEHMASNTGHYVYAVDRIDEFAVRQNLIQSHAFKTGNDVTVRLLFNEPKKTVVTRDFPEVIKTLSEERHAVLIITHEAMKLIDHDVVAGLGWSIIIDEDPKIWSTDSFDLSASISFWMANYTLSPLAKGYSHIRAKADAPSWQALLADDLTRPIAPFHNRVTRGGAVVNLDSWDDLPERKKLTYFTIWSIEDLAVYDRAIILANSFDSLVTCRLIAALHPTVDLVPFPIPGQRVWQHRDVVINYFADDHVAGSTFFKTDKGQQAVASWSKWVTANTNAADHYWSANNTRRSRMDLPGESISPKIAGSNKYRFLNQCSVLYTAKASGPEERVFSELTGGMIDADAVRRDREFEDLIQIVFRSSLRMPDDTRPVMLTVYDSEQAEFLRDFFAQAGFPFTTTLVRHDLGISHQRGVPGPKPNPLKPPMTAAERQRARRERLKAGVAA